MQPLDPSHVQGLKEELERLKQAFHQEQLRMQRKFTAQGQQLKACTQSLEHLQLDKTTDHGSSHLNDTVRSPIKPPRGRTASHTPVPGGRLASQPPLKAAAQRPPPPRGPAPRCGPGTVFGRRPTTVAGSRFGPAHRGHPHTTSASLSSDSPGQANRTSRPASATAAPAPVPHGARHGTPTAKPRVPLKEAVVRCEQHTQRLASRVAALEAEQEAGRRWRGEVEARLAGRERGQADLRETLTGLQTQTERLQESHRKVKEYLNVLTEMVSLEQSLSAEMHSSGASDKPLRTPCCAPSLPLSFHTPDVCIHPATFIPFDAISPNLSTYSNPHPLNTPPSGPSSSLALPRGSPAALMPAPQPAVPPPGSGASDVRTPASGGTVSSPPAASPAAAPAEPPSAGPGPGRRRRSRPGPSGPGTPETPPAPSRPAAVGPLLAPATTSPLSLPAESPAYGSGSSTPLSLPASAEATADLSPPPPSAPLLYQNYEELKRRYQQMQLL